MKQYMKRVILMLCMAACFLSLTACASSKAEEAETLDPQMAAYISQTTESLMQSITAMDEAEAKTSEADLQKQKELALAGGVSSWIGVMKDTGELVEILESGTELGEDETYVSWVKAVFEKRNVEFRAVYTIDNQQQTLVPSSFSFNPEYTIGEQMSKAAMNTLMGMGTVFMVLIFISLLISCFKYINVLEKKLTAPKEAAPAPVAAAPAAEVQEENLADDLELVAVITAAIAASENTSADGLVVRSIKRAPGAKWKRA